MQQPRVQPALLQAIARGSTLLLPSRHAVVALQRAWHLYLAEDATAPRVPARIMTPDALLAGMWHRLLARGQESRVLLNRTQNHALWREIITQDLPVLQSHNPAGTRIASTVDSLAALAADAWQTLHQHEGFQYLDAVAEDMVSDAFARWSAAYRGVLVRESLVTPAQLPAELLHHTPEEVGPLLLVDLPPLAPAWNRLLHHWESHGLTLGEHVSQADPAATPGLLAAEDQQSEVDCAARLIRDCMEQRPGAAVAVVVPDLRDRRNALERALSSLAEPGDDSRPLSKGMATPSSLIEFSIGHALTDLPAIQPGLLLLRLMLEPLTLPEVTALLLSPAFGSPVDTPEQSPEDVASFDLRVVRRLTVLDARLSLEQLENLAAEQGWATRLPVLRQRLHALRQAIDQDRLRARTYRSHAAWADSFRAVLAAAGWSLASGEPELHRRWESSLDEFSTLDFNGWEIPLETALREVTRIAGGTLFAPAFRGAPIQILTPRDLGGQVFDLLIFLSAGDATWPQTPAPSPLIPRGLAARLRLPGTHVARDEEQARLATAHIAAMSGKTIFSFASELPGGRPRVSSAVKSLSPEPLPGMTVEPVGALPLEAFEDDAVLPLPALAGSVPGGASVLQHQSECRFKAFARHRLFTTEPEARPMGLNAGERGRLVHDALQVFWQELGGSEALHRLDAAETASLLDYAIQQALARQQLYAESAWDSAYLQVQQDSLRQLLSRWVDYERDRPPFTVLQMEAAKTGFLGPLRLELRVDRVDQTPEGPVILDYKTGAASPKQWLEDRPELPQLPLYAVLSEEQPAGIAFADLRPGELRLNGFAASEDAFGKVARGNPLWEQQLQVWFATLQRLAQEFAAGETTPNPLTPATCARCSERMLCRVRMEPEDVLEEQQEEMEGAVNG